jgi:hypothetical protein
MSLRRTVSQEPLYTIISPEFFTARGTEDAPVDADTMYRIPIHQRFPSWPLAKKQKLVDSVLRNYPIHAIIAIRQLQNNGQDVVEFCDIEDGQTRMTALQEYLMDEFACEQSPDAIGNGLKFSELTPAMQQCFRTYQVTMEVFSGRQITHDEIAEIFNRLNSGKPLGDNDKYHSRMTSPVLRSLNEIKSHPELRDDINKFIGPIGSGKTRKGLSDMVGAILAIAIDQKACITTSYEQNYRYLNTAFTPQQTENVVEFFKAYFAMLHQSIDPVTAKPKKCYGKLSGVLGLSACSWVIDKDIHNAIGWYVHKLIHNPKYEPATFAELTKGDIRNCQGDAVARRLAKIVDQWEIELGEPGANAYHTQEDDDTSTTGSTLDDEEDEED